MQQQAQEHILQSDALTVLLQHPSVCQEQAVVCRLLCISTALRAAVHQACAALVPISCCITSSVSKPGRTSTAVSQSSSAVSSFSVDSLSLSPAAKLDAFTAWIARHGMLLKQLNVRIDDPSLAVFASTLISNALQKHCKVTDCEDAVMKTASPHQQLPRLVAAKAAEPAGEEPANLPTVVLTAPPRPTFSSLKLQSLSAEGCDITPILEHLPASHLTSLHCSWQPHENALTSWHWQMQRAVLKGASSTEYASMCERARHAIAGLSNLRSLCLHSGEADMLLPHLKGLTNVTNLQLVKISVNSVASLQHLPAQQLQSLAFSVSPNIHGWQRKQLQPQLGYLTALTELSCTGEGLFAVQAEDALPPVLRALTVVDCPAAKPLLHLSHLQVLQMNASTMPAAGLAELSSHLRQLHTVRLCYDRDAAVVAAASAGWAGLPVKNLELRLYPGPVAAATIQHLAQLRGLTHLTIQGFDVRFEATPSQFATVLQQLTNLCELKLASLRMLPEPPVQLALQPAPLQAEQPLEAHLLAVVNQVHTHALQEYLAQLDPDIAAALHQDAGMRSLLRAVAHLPLVKSFSFIRFAVSLTAAAELTAATQLTCLRLDECELTDDAVVAIASGLTQLKRLSLNWNFQLTDKVLNIIGQQLKLLEELSLCSTRVGSVDHLRQLLPGLKIGL